MFYGLLGDMVAATADYTEADPVGIHTSLLAAAGVLVGPGPHVPIGSTRHPLLIWPLVLGSTGTGRKGESLSTAQRFIDAAVDLEAFRVTASGLSSGEGLIEAIRDPVEMKHGSETEVIGRVDKRLLLIEPEFSSVMARGRRDGSTLTSVLRQAWEGRPLSVLNRSALVASSSHIGLIGHITPKEFTRRLAELDMASGLYSRFLPVYVDRSKMLPAPEPIPAELLHGFGDRFTAAVQSATSIEAIRLGSGALRIWKSDLYGELSGDDGEDTAASEFSRRLLPYCLRIAALYAALEHRAQIGTDHLEAAAALCRYSRSTAEFVLSSTRRDPRVDRIRRAIYESADGVTRSQIRDMFGRNLKADVLGGLLAEVVVGDGSIEVVEDHRTGGRPSTSYRAVAAADAVTRLNDQTTTTERYAETRSNDESLNGMSDSYDVKSCNRVLAPAEDRDAADDDKDAAA